MRITNPLKSDALDRAALPVVLVFAVVLALPVGCSNGASAEGVSKPPAADGEPSRDLKPRDNRQSQSAAEVTITPDNIVPQGHEHMLPHYGVEALGGVECSTSAEKLLLFTMPELYVKGEVKQTFGLYPVLLEEGNDIRLSASLKCFGVRWDERFGGAGPFYYVATGHDPKRGRTHLARGKFDRPDTEGNIHRIEEVLLPKEIKLPYDEKVAVWAYIGEGVESIEEMSTPLAERGQPIERAKKADWAFVLFVRAKRLDHEAADSTSND